MNRRFFLWLTAAIVVAAIVVAIAAVRSGRYVNQSSTQAPVIGTAQVGNQAPEFTALTTSGLFDLAKTKRPVFLEVFATWCPHCQRETAIIDRLYKAYKGRVAFVAVSGHLTAMDGRSLSSEEDVLMFRDRFHVLYPIAFDGSLAVASEYLQGGFPTIAVISRERRVTYLNAGEVSYAALNAALKSVL